MFFFLRLRAKSAKCKLRHIHFGILLDYLHLIMLLLRSQLLPVAQIIVKHSHCNERERKTRLNLLKRPVASIHIPISSQPVVTEVIFGYFLSGLNFYFI